MQNSTSIGLDVHKATISVAAAQGERGGEVRHGAPCRTGPIISQAGDKATLSVEENLLLPPKVAEGGMSVAEIYELFPNLSERRNSQGTKLSGGEQQMLAMARILRTGARCLLLDEPTEGLAPVIINAIGDVLRKLKGRGMTVVLVEQNFRFAAKVADRFYLMDHGRMAAEFPVSDLPAQMDMLHRELGV
ncbi:ABC transporter [Paracoccus alcaliphilus]|uniref:ABC transporter n=2 Tax=Paracoccus alcaliphilus TaxID=34002 RepID=A0A1H8ENK5_9RHOB|nr:transporter [Paracoccus alcaliphilus]SEN21171.1 ABC transporter [Paracoccus alcaliphilus]